MNRRRFLRGALAASVAGTAGLSFGAYGLDTHDVDIVHVPVAFGLSKPHRVVALGDIHFDPLYQEPYIERISQKISALKPDLVLFTGDFVTANAERIEDLSKMLAPTTSRLGSFAVLGNHDIWCSNVQVTVALERHGIRVLTNQTIPLPGEVNVYLSGLDSFWAGKPDLSNLLRTPVDSKHILLVHEPDSFLKVIEPRVRLQISGHTHGGQVRVPMIGALILPVWGEHYDAGLFTRRESQLYVNRGIGTLMPHVRFDCPPEITVFELT